MTSHAFLLLFLSKLTTSKKTKRLHSLTSHAPFFFININDHTLIPWFIAACYIVTYIVRTADRTGHFLFTMDTCWVNSSFNCHLATTCFSEPKEVIYCSLKKKLICSSSTCNYLKLVQRHIKKQFTPSNQGESFSVNVYASHLMMFVSLRFYSLLSLNDRRSWTPVIFISSSSWCGTLGSHDSMSEITPSSSFFFCCCFLCQRHISIAL